ncbi:MAG: PKD domain-containing protein, partial [bacterium]
MHRQLVRICIFLFIVLLLGCSQGGNPVAPDSNNQNGKSDVNQNDLTKTSQPGDAPTERIVGNFYYVTEDEETLAWGTVYETEDGWDYRIDYVAPKLQAMRKSEIQRGAQAIIDLTWLNLIGVGVNYTNKPKPTPPDFATYEPGEFMQYQVDIHNNLPWKIHNVTVLATQVNMFNQPLGSDANDIWKGVTIPKNNIQLNADWTVDPSLTDGIYFTRVRAGFKYLFGWITIVIFDSKAGAYKVEKGGPPPKFDPVAKGATTTPIVHVGENVHVKDNGSFDPDGGAITLFQWDFNEDGTWDATGPAADTSYDTPGTKYINLKVTDDEGATDDLTDDPGDALIEIKVLPAPQPPVAVAWASKTDVAVGEEITFHGEDSYDPDGGDIVFYEWDFQNDGTFDKFGDAITTFAYDLPGDYEVQLQVTDNDLLTDKLDQPLTIHVSPAAQKPTACATFLPENPIVCETIDFDASCSTDDGTIDLYEWDWDNDGTFDFNSPDPSAQHAFNTMGPKTVKLQVTDDSGLTDDVEIPVEVGNALPTAVGAPLEKMVYIGDPIDFSGCDSYDNDCNGQVIVQWSWDWDDSSPVENNTTCEATHSYTAAGEYHVNLTVTDDEGGTDSLDSPLVITVLKNPEEPVAVANADPNPQIVCENVEFSGAGSFDPDGGLIQEYAWDFDYDGTFGVDATGMVVNYAFDTIGNHDVMLRVKDDEGTFGFLLTPLTVMIENALPTAVAGPATYLAYVGDPIDFTGCDSYDNDCNGQVIVKWSWDWDDTSPVENNTTC